MSIKSGYVSIIGKPNAGKSTLLNALLGQKLSITTYKPQTTRKKITGILSEDDYQIVFLDTPGILKPKYLLQEKMLDAVKSSVRDADIIIYLADAGEVDQSKPNSEDVFLSYITPGTEQIRIGVINKADISSPEAVDFLLNALKEKNLFDEVLVISALNGFNVNQLKELLISKLPEHPKYFPDEIVSDENERFFVSEIIREKILELYKEEIPYSTEVIIEEFTEREGRKDLIQAMIYVERNSQKGILIGKGGAAIKQLGEHARHDIEEFLDRPVYLELRVKVREDWRSNEQYLKSFGYSDNADSSEDN
ncbi:MAG: GTPase Era [Ignavibacteriaceae bacterium]|nr:GTPase Era [Ignavibacteriaceae bacterium]